MISVFGSYLLWGILPLFFLMLAPTGAWEVVGWRILFSLAFCLLLLTALRGWKPFVAIVRQKRLVLWTGLAGVLIYANWQLYITGILTERIVETSLGYFINPIFTVLLAVVVLRERLRPMQWFAVALAAVAVVVIVVGYGSFPWIALLLALTFGLYGLVKKNIGPTVDAVSGLALETAWLGPVAVVQLVLVGMTTGITMGQVSVGHAFLLALTGIATMLPLLLFAAGTRRVPLSVVGLLQFLAPLMQFSLGVWVMGEPMPLERWVGFVLVWLALTMLTIDMLLAVRRHRRTSRGEPDSALDRVWTGATSLPK